MSINTVLVLILLVMFVSALPVYRYSRGWGYYPSGVLGLVVVLVLLVALL